MIAECPVRAYLKVGIFCVKRVNVISYVSAEDLAVIFTVFIIIGIAWGSRQTSAEIHAVFFFKRSHGLG